MIRAGPKDHERLIDKKERKMETIIYYFTGTGNSLKVAKDLEKELGTAETIPIAKLINSASICVSAPRIGIICPVYMWGLPLIVREFIEKSDFENSQYVFGIVTYGGLPAASLVQFNKLLKQKGRRLSAGFAVHMPGNYTPLYGAFSEKRQKRLFKKQEAKTKQIAATIRDCKEARIEKSFFLVNLIFSSLFYRFGSPKIPMMDKDFWINEKCNGCALCEKICPVNNIKMEQTQPKWQHHCQQCLACLHWCPNEAIEFGKNTPGRKRYHHPQINVTDIIIKS